MFYFGVLVKFLSPNIKDVVLPTREKFVGEEIPIVIGMVDFMEDSVIVIINIVPKG